MSLYRSQPKPEQWFVEATVRGPLSTFTMGSLLEAYGEDQAVEKFLEQMSEGGFEILSEVRATRTG